MTNFGVINDDKSLAGGGGGGGDGKAGATEAGGLNFSFRTSMHCRSAPTSNDVDGPASSQLWPSTDLYISLQPMQIPYCSDLLLVFFGAGKLLLSSIN